MCGIYKITNIVNGKVYIGQSQNIEKRWREHRSRPFQNTEKSERNILYRAIRKYGLEFFEFSVIEECDIKDLNEREVYWIKFYKSKEPEYGYNATEGGDGTRGSEIKLTDEEIKEIYLLLLETELSQQQIAEVFGVSQYHISLINRGINRIQEGYTYPLRPLYFLQEKAKENATTHHCVVCGEPISRWAKKCVKCAHDRQRRVALPERGVLKKLIREKPFTQIGEMYNVTDNAIRKWCDSYNLPRTKKEIKSYSNEQWELI
jgi:group I intron endonuclease